jgi:hypothetical protein
MGGTSVMTKSKGGEQKCARLLKVVGEMRLEEEVRCVEGRKRKCVDGRWRMGYGEEESEPERV